MQLKHLQAHIFTQFKQLIPLKLGLCQPNIMLIFFH